MEFSLHRLFTVPPPFNDSGHLSGILGACRGELLNASGRSRRREAYEDGGFKTLYDQKFVVK